MVLTDCAGRTRGGVAPERRDPVRSATCGARSDRSAFRTACLSRSAPASSERYGGRDVGNANGADPGDGSTVVADFALPQGGANGRLEGQPAARRAAVTHLQDDEAVLGKHLPPKTPRLPPAVVDHLRSGTAVNGDD